MKDKIKITCGDVDVGSVVRAFYLNERGVQDYNVRIIAFTPKRIKVECVCNGYIELRKPKELRRLEK